MKKELKISAISYCTVIDHLPSKSAFKIAELLELNNHDSIISIANNLPSKMLGKKGIIKVADKILSKEQVNKIAIIAPEATVNIIKDYNVIEKIKVKIEEIITNIIKCSNPRCITNNQNVKTKFYVLKKSPLKIKCHYCERAMQKEDIVIV